MITMVARSERKVSSGATLPTSSRNASPFCEKSLTRPRRPLLWTRFWVGPREVESDDDDSDDSDAQEAPQAEAEEVGTCVINLNLLAASTQGNGVGREMLAALTRRVILAAPVSHASSRRLPLPSPSNLGLRGHSLVHAPCSTSNNDVRRREVRSKKVHSATATS